VHAHGGTGEAHGERAPTPVWRRKECPSPPSFYGGAVIDRVMATRAKPTARRRPQLAKPATEPWIPLVLDIDKYGGRWIASQRGKIVAVGDSYAEIDATVRKLGIEDDVILTSVPTTGAFVY
jgi:hypothetical protein